jgi:hypothetical protein
MLLVFRAALNDCNWKGISCMRKVILVLSLLALSFESHASTNINEIEFPRLQNKGIYFDLYENCKIISSGVFVRQTKEKTKILGVPGNKEYEQLINAYPCPTIINLLEKVSLCVSRKEQLVTIVRNSQFISSNLDLCKKFILDEAMQILGIIGNLPPNKEGIYDVRISGNFNIIGLNSLEECKELLKYRESVVYAYMNAQKDK